MSSGQDDQLPKQADLLYLIFKYLETVPGYDATSASLRDDIVRSLAFKLGIHSLNLLFIFKFRLKIRRWAAASAGMEQSVSQTLTTSDVTTQTSFRINCRTFFSTLWLAFPRQQTLNHRCFTK